MKRIRLIVALLISVILIFTVSNVVFADNLIEENLTEEEDYNSNDIWSDPSLVENNTTGDNSIFTELEDENMTFNTIGNENEVENEEEEEYNNLYTTTNSTTSNSENLADTGIGDSNATTLIIIISAVVAIYSAMKYNDYKNV